MNDDRLRDERLRAAFQRLGETADDACSADDLDRVWRAVAGELSGDERRALIDRLAANPALAQAWRAAHELQSTRQADAPAAVAASRRVRRPPFQWLAAAAVLLLAAGGIVIIQRSRPPVDTFRSTSGAALESLIPTDASLPRNDFRLRWTPGPPDSRYQLRVTTADLRVLATATGIPQAEYVVPSEALSSVRTGERVLWQVDATLASGERQSSATFAARIR
ncbi:MAG TPA: hypothetical protein VH417_00805 [Vicinamibacterales bacterium]